MNSMALRALVILVMTLPEATLRAHIVIGDPARACTRILDAAEPWHHRAYALGTIKGLYLGLLINPRGQWLSQEGSSRSQQRLKTFSHELVGHKIGVKTSTM